MGNKLKNKRTSARRAATFLAALGVLVMSSGIALMVTATPANAEPGNKWFVCKFKTTPGSGEVLQSGQNPISVSENAIPISPVVPGASFTDKQGRSFVLVQDTGQAEPPVSECTSRVQPGAATASVAAVQATCTTAASYTTSGSNVTFTQSAAPAAGTSITVTAHAADGFLIDGAATKDFVLNFAAAPVCTTNVTPPTTTSVSPPKIKHTKHVTKATVTPTVVHAGLAGTTVQDVRGEQGLALMVAGMVMLAGAGGLRIRATGRMSRI
jgi:hypothetical protein